MACLMSDSSRRSLFGTLRKHNVARTAADRDPRLFVASRALDNRRVTSFQDLTDADALRVIDYVAAHFPANA